MILFIVLASILLLVLILIPLVGKINEVRSRQLDEQEVNVDDLGIVDAEIEPEDDTHASDSHEDDRDRVFGCTTEAGPDSSTYFITHTLPDCASTLRLHLPVSVDAIYNSDSGGITGFGFHNEEYIEGMYFIRMLVTSGIPIKSWADGTVVSIKSDGEYKAITIDYGRNLIGIHREVKKALVTNGDRVKSGQEIAFGADFGDSLSSQAYSLEDTGRDDGVLGKYGVYVSPFDYLDEDEKRLVVAAFKDNTLDALTNSLDGETIDEYLFRYQPYLSNELVIHNGHEGKITGEWYLHDSWIKGFPNDLLTFIEEDSPNTKGGVVLGMDNENTKIDQSHEIKGTFIIDYAHNTLHIFDANGASYYGLFRIDDSHNRAILTIEYQAGSYPTAFTEEALEYVERDAIPRQLDAESLGVF